MSVLKTTDSSKIVPSVSVKPVFMVPFDRDKDFVGREDIISKIDQHFQTRQRIALAGIGGVG